MIMSIEAGYLFDEPLGVYARKSHEQLTKMVIAGFVRHESAQLDAGFVETLGDSDDNALMLDEFRISSLVESNDSYYGYGLATPRLDVVGELRGVWYQVQRDGVEPAVVDTRHISFPHPANITCPEGKREVQRLMYELDKDQLESTLRMLYKMTKRLQAERPSAMRETETPAGNWLRLIPEQLVENDVLYAIKTHSLDHLKQFFPYKEHADEDEQTGGPDQEKPAETLHILEWTEFLAAADRLLRKQTATGEVGPYVNVRHETENKTYYIRLAADRGQISAAQLLSVDHGGWAAQSFEIDNDDDEDEADINIVSSTMWDQETVVAGLLDGEIIDDETYDGYRMAAAKALEKKLAASRIIYLEDIKKRPAA
jgi:hypothetical protein